MCSVFDRVINEEYTLDKSIYCVSRMPSYNVILCHYDIFINKIGNKYIKLQTIITRKNYRIKRTKCILKLNSRKVYVVFSLFLF